MVVVESRVEQFFFGIVSIFTLFFVNYTKEDKIIITMVIGPLDDRTHIVFTLRSVIWDFGESYRSFKAKMQSQKP